MKLITYRKDGVERVGILSADERMVMPTRFDSMNELICSGVSVKDPGEIQAPDPDEPVALADVELLSPIPRPLQDVICLGINYAAHAEESAVVSKHLQTSCLWEILLQETDSDGTLCCMRMSGRKLVLQANKCVSRDR